jgi:hypothetical protein
MHRESHFQPLSRQRKWAGKDGIQGKGGYSSVTETLQRGKCLIRIIKKGYAALYESTATSHYTLPWPGTYLFLFRRKIMFFSFYLLGLNEHKYLIHNT